MATDPNTPENAVLVDEKRRVSALEDVKAQMQGEIRNDLAKEASRKSPEEIKQVEAVGQKMKSHAISEVHRSENDLERGRKLVRTYQFINYFFYVIYGLVGLMIGLELLGARGGSGFMKMMTTLTLPLLAPFKGVMADPKIGSSQLMLSYVLALVVYALLHAAVKGIFKVLTNREDVDL